MDLSWRHDLWLRRLPRSPAAAGRLERIVVRPPGAGEGARETPAAVELSREGGVEGDRWASDPERDPGAQVSLINVHMVRALAGDPGREAQCGDNLHVDLDLSEANLPPGTRLRIGAAELEVSAVPHRPCRSFHARYGALGAKRVARANRLGLRGRGVLCRVLEPGTVRVGDAIEVLRGPARDARPDETRPAPR